MKLLHSLGILGRGVPPGSPNPDPISDQKISFTAPVFRPGQQNTYPFSDLASKQLYHLSLRLELQISFEFTLLNALICVFLENAIVRHATIRLMALVWR